MKTTDDSGYSTGGAAVSINRIVILVLLALCSIIHCLGVGGVYLRGIREMLRILSRAF